MTPRWTLSNNTMIPDGDSELLSGTRAGAEGGDDAGGRWFGTRLWPARLAYRAPFLPTGGISPDLRQAC